MSRVSIRITLTCALACALFSCNQKNTPAPLELVSLTNIEKIEYFNAAPLGQSNDVTIDSPTNIKLMLPNDEQSEAQATIIVSTRWSEQPLAKVSCTKSTNLNASEVEGITNIVDGQPVVKGSNDPSVLSADIGFRDLILTTSENVEIHYSMDAQFATTEDNILLNHEELEMVFTETFEKIKADTSIQVQCQTEAF